MRPAHILKQPSERTYERTGDEVPTRPKPVVQSQLRIMFLSPKIGKRLIDVKEHFIAHVPPQRLKV